MSPWMTEPDPDPSLCVDCGKPIDADADPPTCDVCTELNVELVLAQGDPWVDRRGFYER
jgi:hypothetical protein